MKVAIYFLLAIWSVGVAQNLATMICTPYLHELINHGIPREFIFQRENNYCVAIADSSNEIIMEGINWLVQQITNAVVVVQEKLDSMTESEFQGHFDYIVKTGGGNHLEFFVGEQSSSNQASRQKKRFNLKAASENSNWLDDFIRFWHLP